MQKPTPHIITVLSLHQASLHEFWWPRLNNSQGLLHFYSFLSLYHSFLFHSTLQDPARFNTFIWVALSCLSSKLFHAAIKLRNPCLTFPWSDNDILPFLWKTPLVLSCFMCAHLSWYASLWVGHILCLFSDSLCAGVSLCRPFLLPQLSAASTFSCVLSSRFQRAIFSVHDEVKSLSLFSGSRPTWGRDLPHTIVEWGLQQRVLRL